MAGMLTLLACSLPAWGQAASANRPARFDAAETSSPSSDTASQDEAALDRMRRIARQQAGQGEASPRAVRASRPAADSAEAGESAAAATPAIEQRQLGEIEDPMGNRLSRDAELDDDGWMLSTLAALGLVIGLILLLRWGWTRMGGKVAAGSSPVVEVLSRTTVAPRNHVLLLRVGGRILVVSDSAGGMRTLESVTDPEEVAELLQGVTAAKETSASRSFGQLLGRFGGDYDQPDPLETGLDDEEHLVDRAREGVSGLLSRVRTMSGKKGEL
ncbi:MAG: flagellar biosynthetic protein FliO [Phycisphaeraceae bacterium]